MVLCNVVALLLPWTACASAVRAMKQASDQPRFFGDISTSYLTHSNLGGGGPDNGSEVMHISGISADVDDATDLIVTSSDSYEANNPLGNGVSHDFGLINVKTNTSAKFWFEFVDSNTRERKNYSNIYLTLYDFDQSKDGTFENAIATSASAYWLTNDTEIMTNVSLENGTWRSSTHGTSKDNPKNKTNMTLTQRARCLTLLFQDTGKIDVELDVKVGTRAPAYGRTFLFDFRPFLTNETKVKPPGWPAQVPGESGPIFHMERAKIKRNNLGGKGPVKDGLRGLVFKKAGSFAGYSFNIAASVEEGTYEPYEIENNGLWNGWGKISGKCGSEVKLRFSFFANYDGFPITVPQALLSLTGIGMDDDGGCAASVSLGDSENYTLLDAGLKISQTGNEKTFSKQSARETDSSQVDMVFENVRGTRATLRWGPGNSGGSEILFKFGNVE